MAGGAKGVVEAKELRCDNCGAPWEMRGFSTTHTVACESCTSPLACSMVQSISPMP